MPLSVVMLTSETLVFFGSPERHLLFDLNDFDEADINPFEWDIKRLAVSTLLAGQEHDFESAKLTELLTGLGQTYRESLNAMFERTALNRFYPVNNVETVLDTIPAKEWHTNKLHKFLEKAGKRDSEQVVRKFTITDSQAILPSKKTHREPVTSRITSPTTSKSIWNVTDKPCNQT